MRLETEDERRAPGRPAAYAVALLLVIGAPAVATASDARSAPFAGPAERVAAGIESLWSSFVDAWHGLGDVLTAATEADGEPAPDVTPASDPACAVGCPERNVELDPDG